LHIKFFFVPCSLKKIAPGCFLLVTLCTLISAYLSFSRVKVVLLGLGFPWYSFELGVTAPDLCTLARSGQSREHPPLTTTGKSNIEAFVRVVSDIESTLALPTLYLNLVGLRRP
jgi:hypothetical protein